MTLKLWSPFAAALLVSLAATPAFAATTITCIGEQTTLTTDGGLTPDKLWPAQLGTLLGAGYTVVNAVTTNGNTIMKGNCVTAASTMGPPNAVIIGPFAEHDYAASVTVDAFQTAYFKVVDSYLALTPKPTVYVMTPPPATFQYQAVNGDYSLEEKFATEIVKPAVLAAVSMKGAKLIDLSADASLSPGAGDGHFTPAQFIQVAKDAAAVIMGTGTGTGGSGGGGSGGGSSGGGGSGGGATGGAATAGASNGGASAGSGGASAAGASNGGTSTVNGGASSGGTAGTAGTSSATGGGFTAGTGGTGTTSSGGVGGGAPGNSAAQSNSSDSGGCTLSPRGSAPSGAYLAALAVALLVIRRRRNAGANA